MAKRMFAFGVALATAFLPPSAWSETRPIGSVYDPRVRTVDYNAQDVVRIVGHFGFSTTIEFADDEVVQSVALGDSLAWEVAPKGNHLFLKPREDNPTTNMAVITNKRSYQFWLAGTKALNMGRGSEMYFAVKFRYPEDERKREEQAREKAVARRALDVAPVPKNWDYWACGDIMLRPTEVFDDGRFTYMRFPAAQEVPAAYVINSDGSESLANGTMRGDHLVLYFLAPKIILRKGKSVGCIENRSYSPYGIYTPTQTVSPDVKREVVDPPAGQVVLPVRASTTPPPEPKATGDDAAEDAGPASTAPPAPIPQVPPSIQMMNIPGVPAPTTGAGDKP